MSTNQPLRRRILSPSTQLPAAPEMGLDPTQAGQEYQPQEPPAPRQPGIVDPRRVGSDLAKTYEGGQQDWNQYDQTVAYQARQDATAKRAATKAEERATRAQEKQRQDLLAIQLSSEGKAYDRNPDGTVQQAVDPLSGKPVVNDLTGPVQYDPTGRAYQVERRDGAMKQRFLDAEAPIGPNPQDPKDPYIYRQNKHQKWDAIDPNEGVLSPDPAIRSASAKTIMARHGQTLDAESAKLRAELSGPALAAVPARDLEDAQIRKSGGTATAADEALLQRHAIRQQKQQRLADIGVESADLSTKSAEQFAQEKLAGKDTTAIQGRWAKDGQARLAAMHDGIQQERAALEAEMSALQDRISRGYTAGESPDIIRQQGSLKVRAAALQAKADSLNQSVKDHNDWMAALHKEATDKATTGVPQTDKPAAAEKPGPRSFEALAEAARNEKTTWKSLMKQERGMLDVMKADPTMQEAAAVKERWQRVLESLDPQTSEEDAYALDSATQQASREIAAATRKDEARAAAARDAAKQAYDNSTNPALNAEAGYTDESGNFQPFTTPEDQKAADEHAKASFLGPYSDKPANYSPWGNLTVNPALTFKPDQYAAAVEGIEAPPLAKEKALAQLAQLQQQAAPPVFEGFLLADGIHNDFQNSIRETIKKRGWKKTAFRGTTEAMVKNWTPEQKAAAVQDFMDSESYSPNANQIYLGLSQGLDQIQQQGYGIASFLGSEAAQKAGEEELRQQQSQGAASAVAGGSKFLNTLTSGATSLAPSLGIGLISGGAGAALGLSGEAAAGAALAANSIAAGMQSAGATMVEAKQAGYGEVGSRMVALGSGLITGGLTRLGGATGTEAIFSKIFQGGEKVAMAAVRPTFTKLLTEKLKGYAVDGLKEALIEEVPDELLQNVLKSATYQPNQDIGEGLVDTFLVSFLLGGGVNAMTDAAKAAGAKMNAGKLQQQFQVRMDLGQAIASQHSPQNITEALAGSPLEAETPQILAGLADIDQRIVAGRAELAKATSKAGRLYSTKQLAEAYGERLQFVQDTKHRMAESYMTAALSEIDSAQPPPVTDPALGMASETPESTRAFEEDKARARALVTIASGEIETLDSSALALVDLTRDETGAVAPLKGKTTSPDGQPRITMQNGQPIISQGTVDRAVDLFPSMAPLLRPEMQQRQTATPAPDSATTEGPETVTQTKQAAATTSPNSTEAKAGPATQQEFDVTIDGVADPVRVAAKTRTDAIAQVAAQGRGMVRDAVAVPKAATPAATETVGQKAQSSKENSQPDFADAITAAGVARGLEATPERTTRNKALAKALVSEAKRWQGAFPGGVRVRSATNSGGVQIASTDRALEIDFEGLAASAENTKGNAAEWARRAIQEEVIHSAALELEKSGKLDAAAIYNALPAKVQRTIRQAYAASKDPRNLGHEFIRFIVQGRLAMGANGWTMDGTAVTTEQASPTLKATIKRAIETLLGYLKDFRKRLEKAGASAETITAIDDTVSRIESRLLEFEGKTAPAPEPKAEPAKEKPESKPDWQAFDESTGTLAIPRAEMPQVASGDRSSLVQFLRARGIDYTEETVPADSLKPTQAEYSQAKVEAAKQRIADGEAGDRALLVSQDGYVLDGHHQWLARAGEDVRILRLNAPVRAALAAIAEFPSVDTAGGASDVSGKPTAITQHGVKLTARFAVRERASLLSSHDYRGRKSDGYDQSLQPRDRSLPEYQKQSQNIARELSFDQAAYFPDTDVPATTPDLGAPVIDAGGQVIVGNGRYNGIAMAYGEGFPSAAKYKADFVRNAKSFGLDPKAVAAMNEPVLVRVLDPADKETVIKFSQGSNEGIAMRTNAVELAGQDAQRLAGPARTVLGMMDPNYDLEAKQNEAFRQAYVTQVIAAGGSNEANLTGSELASRIRMGIFASAYGLDAEGRAALARMAGETDDGAKKITGAMLTMAAGMGWMKAEAQAGNLYERDISADLGAAAQRIAVALRDKPAKTTASAVYEGLLAQPDALEDPMVNRLMQFMVENRANRGRIEEVLSNYIEGVVNLGNPSQADMFGDEPAGREALWARALDPATGTDREINHGLATQALQSQPAQPLTYPHEKDGDFRTNWKVTKLGRRVKLADGREGRVMEFRGSNDFDVVTNTGPVYGLSSSKVSVKLTDLELELEPHLVRRLETYARLNAVFADTVRAVAGSLPDAIAVSAPLKGAPRALEKAAQKLKAKRLDATLGGFEPPSPEVIIAGLHDLMRASIIVDTADQVLGANAAILRAFAPESKTDATEQDSERHYQGKGVEVFIEDRFIRPTAAGYSDVQIKVEVIPGHYAELQVHLPEMLAAKEGNGVKEMGLPEKYWPENLNIKGFNPSLPGHKLFEKARSMPSGTLEREQLESRMRDLYTEAIRAAEFRAQRSAASAKASSRVSGFTQGSSPVSGSESGSGTNPVGTTNQAFPSSAETVSPSSSRQNVAASGTSDLSSFSASITNYFKAALSKNQGVVITTDNISEHLGSVNLDHLKGRQSDWRKAFKQVEGMRLVPLSKLVSRKNELMDPKFLAGKKADPRQTAGTFIGKALDGEAPPRSPLDVYEGKDGTYEITDGNATAQALMIAGWPVVPVMVHPAPLMSQQTGDLFSDWVNTIPAAELTQPKRVKERAKKELPPQVADNLFAWAQNGATLPANEDVFSGLRNDPGGRPGDQSRPGRGGRKPASPAKDAELGDLFALFANGAPEANAGDASIRNGDEMAGSKGGDAGGSTGADGGPDTNSGAAGGGGGGTADGSGASRLGKGDEAPAGQSGPRLIARPEPGSPEHNVEIRDAETLSPHGLRSKLKANLAALEVLARVEKENRNATADEKRILVAYSGWGALPQVFDEMKATAVDPDNQEKYRNEQFNGEYWNSVTYMKQEIRTAREKAVSQPYSKDFFLNRADELEAKVTAAENWQKQWGEAYRKIRATLTPAEWDAARLSTLNAHYTSPGVIRAMWKAVARLGFKGGKVLEPAGGIGHFFGLMPEDIADRSRLTGVELDSLTSRIFAKLYPEADVISSGYETSGIANGTQDLVISNVPFANFKVDDPTLDALGAPGMSLHNYFFAKALQHVKPGGLVAFITTAHTADSNLQQRKFIAQHGDLVGMIRLPNDAFKENAGTDVVTDIIFLRKPDNSNYKGEAWTGVRTVDASGREAEINEYFARNPDMILGRLAMDGKMYRDPNAEEGEMTVHPTGDLAQALDRAIERLPENIMGDGKAADTQRTVKEADKFKIGTLHYNSEGKLEFYKTDASPPTQILADDFISLRDALTKLYAAELNPDSSDAEVESLRANLNKQYDRFVQRQGDLHSRASQLRTDPDFYRLAGLELEVKPEGTNMAAAAKAKPVYKKAPVFERRVLSPLRAPDSVESIEDAVVASLAWKGGIDSGYVAKLLGRDVDTVESDLLASGQVAKNPQTSKLEPMDEYLSGNVRAKLKLAEAAAKNDPFYQDNVERLKAVQPARVPFEDLGIYLGAGWIPTNVIQEWLKSIDVNARVTFVSGKGEMMSDRWFLETSTIGARGRSMGIEKATIADLLEMTLNLQSPNFFSKDAQGNRIKDPKSDESARLKIAEMKENWAKWVKDATPMHEILTEAYNDRHNGYRKREYNGQHLKLPWVSKDFDLYPSKKNVVWRALSDGRALLAHGVGGGKTVLGTAIAMEMKRLGMAKKPMIVVHNATLEQFAMEIGRIAPTANVLVARKQDLEKSKRKEFYGRIQSGDWDIVVIAQSAFNMIPDDPQSARDSVKELEDQLKEAIRTAQAMAGEKGDPTKSKDPSVKAWAKMLKALRDRIKELQNRKVDDLMTFEEMGVDALIIDEAHLYKKLPFVTKIQKVAGIDSGASQRGTSLLSKARYIQKMNRGRNVFTMTGTPVTNTLGETWNALRLIAPDLLAENRVANFDAFVSTFAKIETRDEMGASGKYKRINRLASIVNLPEWNSFFGQVADVALGADMVVKNRPGIEGGAPQLTLVKRTPGVGAYIDRIRAIVEKWEGLSGREKKETSALPIVAYGASRAAAIDLRLVDPNAKDEPGSKANQCIQRVLELAKVSEAYNGTQVIFADSYKAIKTDYLDQFGAGNLAPALDMEEDEDTTEDEDGNIIEKEDKNYQGFHLYRDMKRKLIAGGLHPDQVAIISDHDTPAAREKLFAAVNDGKVRVIIGSTQKLGTGVNMQRRMIAAHQLDVPWTPADMEQRDGRVFRQGNIHGEMGKNIHLLRYGMEDTLDSALWQKQEDKLRFTIQALSGKLTQREIEDNPAMLSAAEVKALLTGADGLKKFQYEQRLRELSSNERAWYSNRQRQSGLLHDARFVTNSYPDRIAKLEARQPVLDAVASEDRTFEINGRTVTEKEAAKMIREAMANATKEANETMNPDKSPRVNRPLMELTVNGHNVLIGAPLVTESSQVDLERTKQQWKLTWPISVDGESLPRTGNTEVNGRAGATSDGTFLTALDKAADRSLAELVRLRDALREAESQVKAAESELAKPFADAAEMEQVTNDLAALMRKMSGMVEASKQDETPPLLSQSFEDALRGAGVSLASLDDYTTAAESEVSGERTVGNPDLSLGGGTAGYTTFGDPVIMGVDAYRAATAVDETMDQWDAAATAMLRSDYEGTARWIIENGMQGGQLTPELTRAAQMIVETESKMPMNSTRQRRLQSLVYAYRQAGTEQARGLAARRDPFKTPEQRNREFLAKQIFTPPADVRKKMEAAATPAERQKVMDDDGRRIRKIQVELAKMGVTLEDLFGGGVQLSLRNAAMVKQTAASLGEKESRAAILLQDGTKGFIEIGQAVGLTPQEVRAVKDKMKAKLAEQLRAMRDRAKAAKNLASAPLSSAPADLIDVDFAAMAEMSDEDAEAEIQNIIRRMGYFPDKQQGKRKTVKRKRRLFQPPAAAPGMSIEDYAALPPLDNHKGTQAGLGMPPTPTPGMTVDEFSRMPRQPVQDATQPRLDGLAPAADNSIPPGEGKVWTRPARNQDELGLGIEEAVEMSVLVGADLADIEDTVRMARVVQAVDAGPLDMLQEFWINNLLSGPMTQVTNIAGNVAASVWEMTVQRGLEATLNLAVGDQKGAQMGEFAHLAAALRPGIARGFKLMAKAWRTETDWFAHDVLNNEPELFETGPKGEGTRVSIPGRTGRVIRIPGRALMAVDGFFKGTIAQMEATAQAYRIAKAEGLTGEDLKRRMNALIYTPGSQAWQLAVTKATDLTFQTELPDSLKPLQQWKNSSRLLGFILPFIRTPYNIFRTGVRKSPLGAAHLLYQLGKHGLVKLSGGRVGLTTATSPEMMKYLAEQTIAFAALALLKGAAEGDDDDESKSFLITGSAPGDWAAKDLQERTAGGSYVIRIGSTRIPYGRIEPLATVLGSTVDALRTWKGGGDHAEKAGLVFGALKNAALDKTFLSGLAGVFDAAKQPGTLMDKGKKFLLTALVPNLIRQPLRNMDPVVRDATTADWWYSLLPLGSGAEGRVNTATGEDKQKSGNALTRLIAPAIVEPGEVQASDIVLRQWNQANPGKAAWSPSTPERTQNIMVDGKKARVKLNAQAYHYLSQRSGVLAKNALSGLDLQPTEEGVKRIRDAYEDARRRAWSELKGRPPEQLGEIVD